MPTTILCLIWVEECTITPSSRIKFSIFSGKIIILLRYTHSFKYARKYKYFCYVSDTFKKTFIGFLASLWVSSIADTKPHSSFKIIFIWNSCFFFFSKAKKENVCIIHCLAGKGRTGTIVCCYLIYSGLISTTENALHYYSRKRLNIIRNQIIFLFLTWMLMQYT